VVKMNFTNTNFMNKRHRGNGQSSVFKSKTEEPLQTSMGASGQKLEFGGNKGTNKIDK
jgi:hypothetical protein